MAPSPVTSTQSPLSSRADSVLALGYTTAQPSQIYTTSPALVAQLCHLYKRQVDPIVKILHMPTLEAYLVDCKGFLDYDLCDPSPAALRAAVCYAAIASMTEDQCKAIFSCPKSKVLPEFRNNCAVALNRAGLLTTTDMTVLQAFVLYLVSPFFLTSHFTVSSMPSMHNIAHDEFVGSEANRGSQPSGMDFDRHGSEDSKSPVAKSRAAHHLGFLLSTANGAPSLVHNMRA